MSHEIAPTTMKELRGVLIRWAVVLIALGAFALWATWRMSSAASRLPAPGAAVGHKSESGEPVKDVPPVLDHGVRIAGQRPEEVVATEHVVDVG